MDKKIVANFLHENLSYKIRGACFAVYSAIGGGHKESVYQKALALELEKVGIKFEREKTLNIFYEKEQVGTYKPDFIIEDQVIIEMNAVPFVTKDFEVQLLNYLKATKLSLGFLINFGPSKVDIRRRVNFHNQG